MAITVNNKKIRELLDENDRTALWASGRIEELERKLETKIEEKEPEMPEPERPNKDGKGEKLLWYPQATVPSRKMPDRGLYKNGKGHDLPSGIVWHFSAGRLKPAINTHNWGDESRLWLYDARRRWRVDPRASFERVGLPRWQFSLRAQISKRFNPRGHERVLLSCWC
jgi:hypothetical protein